jgi:beta-galactosidase
MKGHNYYVFTGGPNPPEVGETTDLYDYGAPIGPYGQIRPLYKAQVEFGETIARYPWLIEAKHVYDCRLGSSFEYARAERYWLERGSFLFSSAEAWRFLAAGLLTTAFCASLSPAGINLDAEDWVTKTDTPVIIASGDSMPRAEQEHIVRFLKNGGRALIAPILPRFDERLQPCRLLSDFLGAPHFAQGTEAVIRVAIGEKDEQIKNVLKSEVFFTEELPEEATVVGYDECTGRTLAWEVTTSGGGRAILLGMTWEHRKHEQSQALLWLMKRLDLTQTVVSTNPNVWTSLRAHGDRALLFMMNLFSSPMKTKIRYCTHGGAYVDLGEQSVEAMSVALLEVER